MFWPKNLSAFCLGFAALAYDFPWWGVAISVLAVAGLAWRYRSALMLITLVSGLAVGYARFYLWPHAWLVPMSSSIDQVLIQARALTRGVFSRQFPEPEASFASGLLIGTSGQSSQGAIKNLFTAMRITGTLHVLAVSGYNVSIVLASVERACTSMFTWRVTLWVSLAALLFFVLLTGAEPSVVRAGIMGSLGLAARRLGRPASVLRLLMITALAMVAVSPAIAGSLGFQLSVLATAGLIIWSEAVEQRLWFVTNKAGVRSALATTLAAQILTTPLLWWRFGQLSLIAPVVNALVLPMVPVAMAAGALTVAVSWLPQVGLLMAWFAWLPHMLIVRIIQGAAQLPGAMIKIPASGLLIILAVMIVCIIFKIFHAQK